MKYSSL